MSNPTIASMTSMKVDGFDDVLETLREVAPREAMQILRTAVHSLAMDVRDELKARVKVDSGALRKSIKAIRRRGTKSEAVSEVRGGATAPYMLMLEFGTSRTDAQPFIVPTAEGFRPKLPSEYKTAFGEKLEKALARRAKKSLNALGFE